MENHKRRLVTFSENDRISNLPQHLIDSIFERLPFQDVMKTSILSKKWRYKWTRMKALVADEKFSKKFAKNGSFGQRVFIRIINQVLLLHEGPISKFHLYIPDMFCDSIQEIGPWMLLLSRKGVRDLVVVNPNRHYQLLYYLFSCLELRNLKLVNCIFNPPFKLQEFLYLEDLFLENIDFRPNLRETVINLPQLKSLVLNRCAGVSNFNIKATKLQKLLVDASPHAKLLRFFNNESISVIYTFICKAVENLDGVERMSLTRMLSNIDNIQRFIFNGVLKKSFIVERTPKWLPHEINSLWQLVLLEFELRDLNQLECALCLLRKTRNLKELKIKHVQMEPQDINVEQASNHLEPPDCLDQTLNQLQTVEIKGLRGLRPEVLFIKLLLAHSPSLEKLTVQSSQTCDAIKRLDIAVDIMRFPRASPKAELVFLNSNP